MNKKKGQKEPKLSFKNTRSRFYHKRSSHEQENSKQQTSQKNTGIFWKQKGNQQFKKNNITLAIQYYTKAIQLSPGQSIFYSNRSKCYKLQNNYKAALKDSQQACQLDDNNIKAHYLCGCILAQISKQDFSKIKKAQNRLKKALRLCSSQGKQNFIQQISIKLYRLRKLAWFIEKEDQILSIKQQLKAIELSYNKKIITKQQYQKIKLSIIKRQEKNKQNLQIPDHLCCKITLQLMEEPVCTQAGFSYQKSALQDHCKTNGLVQPISRKPISGKFYPNIALKNQIQLFLEQNPWAFQHSINEDYMKIDFS